MTDTSPPAGGVAERIAILVYPGFTALDLFGPHHMLAGLRPARLDLVGRTRAPVQTDTGVTITPSAGFDDIAPGLDILLVPGGTEGTLAAMEDADTRAFLAAQGAAARYITSVCTGSLILGAAGLLRGRRATSHWVTLEVLRHFGAIPVAEHVVEDGNVMTGAGVSAGLDLGLTLVARLRDQHYAERVQLVAEYDPHPPLHAGSPALAPPGTTAATRALFAPFVARLEAVAAGLVAQ